MKDLNVLYIDYEQENLNYFNSFFKDKYTILSSKSGVKGLELINNQVIDLIIIGLKIKYISVQEFLRKLKEKRPELNICGMGGPELASVGVEILFDAAKVSVVGVFEVFSHLKDIFKAQRILRKRLETDRPELLILIDLPDFNFLLARKAKRLSIPVFYYISPQVWAWLPGAYLPFSLSRPL